MRQYFDLKNGSLSETAQKIREKALEKEGNMFTKALMAARENGKKYFTVNGKEYKTEALDDKDISVIKKVAGKLKGASQAHAGQSKDLEKALSDEVKYPHDMFDPKTGKKEVAKNVDDHNKLAKMGYTHDDPKKKEDNTNDKSDDGEGLDKVQPKAVKKKFKDRKDKDIDNDGDVDSTDKYLHKRRKAISKAIAKQESISDIQNNKNLSMREALAKIWNADSGKSYFEAISPAQQAAIAISKKERGEKPKKEEKTLTGKKETKVEINPKV